MNSGDELKVSHLLRQRMAKALSESFGMASAAAGSFTVTQAKIGQGMSVDRVIALVEEMHDVVKQMRSIYYLPSVAVPEDEAWLLSANKKVVLLHPDGVLAFVNAVKRDGFFPVALDFDNKAHQQLWLEALPIEMRCHDDLKSFPVTFDSI